MDIDIFYNEVIRLKRKKFRKYCITNEKKIKKLITHKNARFIDDLLPSSRQMGVLSFNKFNDNQFEDLNNFEPFYLKDFIGTKWNATQ